MSALVSTLSLSITVTVSPAYTTPSLVSAITGGEILTAEVLSELISAATEEIERRTGMCFRIVAFTDEVDGNDLSTVFAHCFPIFEIFSVTMDGVLLPASAYVLNKRTGSIRLKNGAVFPEGVKNIVITGLHGHKKIPPLIQKIASLIVAKTILSAKNGPLVDSESIGDFSQTRGFKKLNDELDRAWGAWGRKFPIDFV
ncbi:MAG: hypothetical protein HY401_04130 [Elusimicrobia bacterium]|nr:hypothetical protein [Elusimicrobiota bacterium]